MSSAFDTEPTFRARSARNLFFGMTKRLSKPDSLKTLGQKNPGQIKIIQRIVEFHILKLSAHCAPDFLVDGFDLPQGNFRNDGYTKIARVVLMAVAGWHWFSDDCADTKRFQFCLTRQYLQQFQT